MLAGIARGARAVFIPLFLLAFGSASWAQIEVADDLLVDLDASDPSAGTDVWVNLAPETIGDFIVPPLVNDAAQTVGIPIKETIEGVQAVTFNSTGNQDLYQCENPAPDGLVGIDPTRSIEAWVYNPTIADEETILAWGWRGGPDGSNMSFNYGMNQFFGAIGHWGGAGPDLGWNNAGGAPSRGRWHHLVYTYDGATTRVYADGCVVDETNCETNSEALAPGLINTHTPANITLAAQLNDMTGTPNFGLRGTLSIAKVRIHDGVLTPEQIQNNFDIECETYCPPPGLCECDNCPTADQHFRGKATYTRQLTFDAVPPPTGFNVTQPAGATISQTGLLSYTVPTPAPASFNVRVECTNPQGTGAFTWTVTLVDAPPRGDIEVAGDLLVDLHPNHASAGSPVWLNAGTLADFGEVGDPLPALIGPESSPAVSFNEGTTDDAYQCFENAPDGVTGLDPTRSIEVWSYNPTVDVEETLVAWGWRGGPAGTNMSFNYGNHGTFGAVGHWDFPDLGWSPLGTFPVDAVWHHLVYTYDGTTTRVYADGLQSNFETLGPGIINTYSGSPITLAVQVINATGSLDFGVREGVLSLGRVRVHDGVLSPAQVFANFSAERDIYGTPEPPLEGPMILNAPADGVFCAGADTYSATILATGVPPPTLAVVQPAGATISEGGIIFYDIPDPPPPSFVVEVTATNPVDTVSAVWTVTRETLSGGIETAEDLLVNLDARDPTAGGDFWANPGSLDDFERMGNARLTTRQGIRAVSFNEDGRTDESYVSVDDAPAGIVGIDPTRTIEAWVWNGTIADEETILAWGHRGGVDGENMSFNYGTNGAFGAIGHWGGAGPDLGWGMVPAAGTWHHLAYTYDGTMTRVFADGVQTSSELLGPGVINTFSPTKIVLARQIEVDGVTLTPGLQGSLAIARVRIHDGVLSPCQILNNYQVESPEFTAPPCPQPGNPDFADTHCTGLQVMETGNPIGNTHIATATGEDDSGDGIVFTFTATDGVDTVIVGPTTQNLAGFTLRTGGPWTFSVTVDDRVECDDQATDATCTPGGGGGGFRRGDADDSGAVNLTDAIRVLNVLFLGIGTIVCSDAADADDSGQVNLTDAIRILNVLFLGIGTIEPPGPDSCGPDPTEDTLADCQYGAAC
jgi:hypothetical protein